MAIFEGKVSAREFLVDFFGALMPGVFFLIFVFLGFFLPGLLIFQSLYCFWGECKYTSLISVLGTADLNILDQIAKIPVIFDIALFIVFLAIGYIVGTLFYRQDPKIPDYKSFLRIVHKFSIDQEVENWVVRVPKKEESVLKWYNRLIIIINPSYKYHLFKAEEDGISDLNEEISKESYNSPNTINQYNSLESDVQFPYNNLKTYLKSRGWNKLSEIVKWDYHNGKILKEYPRSKTFINTLKIRLQFYFPEQCSTIVKNEAHVRLSSSMWYVSTRLITYSGVGILMSISSLIIYMEYNISAIISHQKEIGLIMLIIITIHYMSRKIKKLIETFLHYQRVREIFYVLQTASAAAMTSKENEDKMFADL